MATLRHLSHWLSHWNRLHLPHTVGPGAKYIFGGPDDDIMYSSGTRVYWKRGRTLRFSALKSSDYIYRGLLGHSPEKFRVSEMAFPAFCERFWAKSNSRFLRSPSQVGGTWQLAPSPPPPPPPLPSRRPCSLLRLGHSKCDPPSQLFTPDSQLKHGDSNSSGGSAIVMHVTADIFSLIHS